MKKALIAFGGNALIKAGEAGYQKQQIENAKEAAEIAVKFYETGYLPVIIHGNGPQVGNVLIQQEEAANKVPPYTMDICGAQTQGSMGYLLERCIQNMLKMRGLESGVATLLTQVVVDAADPGFQNPTKPVGPFYEAFRARQLEMEKGWTMKEDSGRGWRRLVPSPKPVRIVQLEAARLLTQNQMFLIACGGGGIPVVEDASGYYLGVEAVIDKDRTAALLGQTMGLEVFVILTGVDKVAVDFGKPSQRNLDVLTVADAKHFLAQGQFPAGSMGPKIESAISYIEGGGEAVLITSAEALLNGELAKTGTRIIP